MILKHIQIWGLLSWGITLLIDDIFLLSFIVSVVQVHQLPVLLRKELEDYCFMWVSYQTQKMVSLSPSPPLCVLFLLVEGYFTISM